MSDESYDELHAFADQLGNPRRALQGDHYDVPQDYRARAYVIQVPSDLGGQRGVELARSDRVLNRAIQLSGPIGRADFQGTPQTRLLLDRYLRHTDRGWKAAVYERRHR